MARKPIDQEFLGLQTPRERMWRAILASPERFTVKSAQDLCRPMVRFTQVEDYMAALSAAGYVVPVAGNERLPKSGLRTETVYTVAKRVHDTPRIDKQGRPVTQGMATTSMWRAMKVLKIFNHRTLADAATLGACIVSPIAAKQYLFLLSKAGYLAQVRASKPGTPTEWRLVKNTGPHAPAVTRAKVVFDRNTGKFAPLQTAQEVCDGIDA